MKDNFPSDTYDTPEDTSRVLVDRLCLGSPIGFYMLHLKVVLKARSAALKNQYDDEKWAQNSFEVLRNLEGCGARFHLKGLHNLRGSEKPLVFISNHMSSTETQVFPCLIAPYRPVTFIVKESLVRMPIFGPVMRSRNPITVGRMNPREDMQTVLTRGTELLSQGISIIVFPQSTRHIEFMPEKFNSLGIKLAKRAGVRALPVAIKTDFWGNGRRLKDFGPLDRSKPIYMLFGEPMEIHGSGKEQHQAIVEFIQSHLREWGD